MAIYTGKGLVVQFGSDTLTHVRSASATTSIGTVESYFVQGINKEKGTYKKNKKEGEWLTFHTNGVITSRCNYRNGLTQGWAYGYDTKGKLLGKSMFNKGVEIKGEELDKYLEFCKQKGIDPNN